MRSLLTQSGFLVKKAGFRIWLVGFGAFCGAYSLPALAKTDLKIQSGFLSILNHRVQFGEENTHFDYKNQGGQDTLYNTNRYTADVSFENQDKLVLVYQPIEILSSKTIDKDLKVDNETFPAGTPMKFRYSFPYYRVTHLWNLTEGRFESHLGLGLQIRNAVIEFASADGSQQTSNRNVGPVPLFAFHCSYSISDALSIDFEVEGNYANTSVINGDDDDGVTGAIADIASSVNHNVSQKVSTLAELRYITGGARGTSSERENEMGDGFSSNWIDALMVTVGLVLHLDEWK